MDNKKNKPITNKNSIKTDIKEKNPYIKIIFTGFVTGLLSGLFASGGGLIAIPCFIYIFKNTEKEARANTIFCIIPTAMTTMIIYNNAKYLDLRLGILCGIGGILGGIIGSKILRKISDKYLIIIFIIFLIYSAISLIIK